MNQETLEVVLKLRNQLTPDIQKGAAAAKVSFDKITAGADQALSAIDRLASSLSPGSKLNAGVLKYAQLLDAAAAAEKAVADEAEKLADAVKKSGAATKAQNNQLLKAIVRFGKFALGIGAAAIALNALKRQIGVVISASVELGVKQAELEGKTFAYKDATDKLTESYKAWLASIGDFLTRNPQVVAALNVLSNLFLDLADANIAARDEMDSLVGTGFVELVDGALAVARAVNGVIRVLNLATQTVLRLGLGFNNAAIAVDNFFGITTPQFILDFSPALQTALDDVEAAILILDAGTDAIIKAQRTLANITGGGGAPVGRDITDRGGVTGGGIAAAIVDEAQARRDAQEQWVALIKRGRENWARNMADWNRTQEEAVQRARDIATMLNDVIEQALALQRQRDIAAMIERRGFPSELRFDTAASEGLLFRVFGGQAPEKKGQPRFSPDFLENLLGAGIGMAAGGGGFAGLLPLIGSAFGPVGGAIGGALASIFGKKKRGAIRSNPVFVEEVKKGDAALALLNIFKGMGAARGGRTIDDINNLIRGGGATLGFSSAPA